MIKLDYLQKAKIILVINFIVLFCIIIATPFFVKNGFFVFSEELVEGVFLAIELVALIFIFRHYDAQIKKYEEEKFLLNIKLKKKERELLSALEYLGKVNVQVSMIKSLFEKIKIPSSKNQLQGMYSELLRIVASITKEKVVVLRIINLKDRKTVGEQVEFLSEPEKDQSKSGFSKIGNKELLKRHQEKSKDKINNFRVFYSDIDNFYIKAFIFVPNTQNSGVYSDEREFLEAVANQCEVLHILFNSRYYKDR